MNVSTEPDSTNRARLVQHYNRLAPRYSQLYTGRSRLAHFYNVRQARVQEMLDVTAGRRVLEVGCGPGHLARYAADTKGFYCGVDLSPGMIRVCRDRHADLDRAHFAVGDTQALALADRSFDVVICLGMLEYVTREEVAIAEIARVLAPGGHCILSGINRWSPYNVWDRAVHRRLKGSNPVGIVHEYHVAGEYRAWLRQHGLDVVDIVYFDFVLLLPPLDRYAAGLAVGTGERLERCCRSWCRGLGNGFLVKAKRLG